MKRPPKPARVHLLAAVLGGLAVWLTGLDRFDLSAAAPLPWAVPVDSGSVAVIRAGTLQNPLPREPMALAVLSGGDLLVADVAVGEIYRFSPDGRLRGSYGGAQELRYPVGLAVDENDRVWVADLWQGRVFEIVLATGRLSELPRESSGYRAPAGLAYHEGLLYVTDLQSHQILVVRPEDGSLVRILGNGRGTAPGQLAYPNAVWVSEEGEVYVSDSNNRRIQVFDAEGRLHRVLAPHRLTLPRGLVQDQRGLLHVADAMAHDIAVLDRGGQIVARYGSSEQLTAPNALALRGRTLYIADRGNSRVLAWNLDDG